MTLTLDRQQPTQTHIPYNYFNIYKKLELQWIRIGEQIDQLKSTFEIASFILTKRDFERLDALELSQRELRRKIKLFIQKRKTKPFELQRNKKPYQIVNLANEIELGLSRLSNAIASLKQEKFSAKNNYSIFL